MPRETPLRQGSIGFGWLHVHIGASNILISFINSAHVLSYLTSILWRTPIVSFAQKQMPMTPLNSYAKRQNPHFKLNTHKNTSRNISLHLNIITSQPTTSETLKQNVLAYYQNYFWIYQETLGREELFFREKRRVLYCPKYLEKIKANVGHCH